MRTTAFQVISCITGLLEGAARSSEPLDQRAVVWPLIVGTDNKLSSKPCRHLHCRAVQVRWALKQQQHKAALSTVKEHGSLNESWMHAALVLDLAKVKQEECLSETRHAGTLVS